MLPMESDDARWAQVLARSEDAFVFGVTTTGIYCRPSCPARHAKRENVRFFDTPDEAQAAGFRACKRCKPDLSGAPHKRLIEAACRAIAESEDEPDLACLAADANLSPGHFQRVFKAHTDLTPKNYARAIRKQRLQRSLGEETSVTHAIYAAGYSSSSRAYADMAEHGLTLKSRKTGAQGETLFFAQAHCEFGPLLLAFSAKGLCLVEFHDEADEAETILQKRFPKAAFVPAMPKMQNTIKETLQSIENQSINHALSLDIRGTVFQEKIWRALCAIPKGETRSYNDIARAIGEPKAARAVARACASNHMAVLVPCHRVVRENGDVSGYKWGVERKKAILKKERC